MQQSDTESSMDDVNRYLQHKNHQVGWKQAISKKNPSSAVDTRTQVYLCKHKFKNLWILVIALLLHDLLAWPLSMVKLTIATRVMSTHHPVMSLRQVPVPVMSEQPYDEFGRDSAYSPNNRGFQSKSTLSGSTRFGQRTNPIERFKSRYMSEKRRSDGVAWSQPDPRKSYSLPVSLMGEFPTRKEATDMNHSPRVSKLNVGFSLRGSTLSASDSESNLRRTELVNSVGGGIDSAKLPAANLTQDDSEHLQPWKSDQSSDNSGESSPSNRRKMYLHEPHNQQQSANMITLIRYVPVLMSVPAEHLLLPSKISASSMSGNSRTRLTKATPEHASTINDATHLITTTPPTTYYGLHRLPSSQDGDISSSNRLLKYQLSPQEDLQRLILSETSTSFNKNLDSDYTLHYAQQPPPALNNGLMIQASSSDGMINQPSAANTKLALLPTSHSMLAQVPASSKALTAYASKLISMLRPSALLSSIGNNQQVGQNSQQTMYPIASQPHIYLLAPAEGLLSTNRMHSNYAYSTTASPAPYNLQPSITRPDDLLLNQASRPVKTTQRSPNWVHQQPNGLICVHSLVQQNGKIVAQSDSITSASQFTQSAEIPTTTVANFHTSTNNDASFDYFTSPISTTEVDPSTKQGTIKHSQPSSNSFNQYRSKQSPAKIAKKLHPPAQTSQFDYEKQHRSIAEEHAIATGAYDQDRDFSPQQKMIGLSSEGNAIVDNNNSDEKHNTNESSENSPSYSLGNQNIGHLEEHQSGSRLRTNSSRYIIPFTIEDKIDLPSKFSHHRQANQITTRNPVQYDEPVDGESAEPLKDNKHFSTSQNERRVKTSFVSTTPLSTAPSTVVTNKKKNKNRRPMSKKQKQQHSVAIDYRKEVGSSQRESGFGMPLLMASTSQSRQNNQNKSEINQKSGVGEEYGEFQQAALTRSPGALKRPASPAPPPQSTKLVGSSHASASKPSEFSDEQPVTLSGDSFKKASNPERAEESRLVLVSSASLTGTINNDTNSIAIPEKRTYPHTVELVVNSTPEIVTASTLSTPTPTPPKQTVTTGTITPGEIVTAAGANTTVTGEATNEKQVDRSENEGRETSLTNEVKQADNHQPDSSNNNAFTNSRLLSVDSSMDEFGRISESLQTNPLDLIDLQNSRSSFELPSQLESLSMLFSRQPTDKSSSSTSNGVTVGPLRWSNQNHASH